MLIHFYGLGEYTNPKKATDSVDERRDSRFFRKNTGAQPPLSGPVPEKGAGPPYGVSRFRGTRGCTYSHHPACKPDLPTLYA